MLLLFCGAVFNSNKPNIISLREDHMQSMYISMTYLHIYISSVTLHLFIFLLKRTISTKRKIATVVSYALSILNALYVVCPQ